jgi:hypothetical protein
MNGKQLTIEDVIKQLNGIINNVDEHATPTAKTLYVNAAQMAVARKLMEVDSVMRPADKDIYEKEEPDEVPQVQRNDNSK